MLAVERCLILANVETTKYLLEVCRNGSVVACAEHIKKSRLAKPTWSQHIGITSFLIEQLGVSGVVDKQCIRRCGEGLGD